MTVTLVALLYFVTCFTGYYRIAISKDMWAITLCTNKILHFLTEGADMQVDLYNGCKMVVVVVHRISYNTSR